MTDKRSSPVKAIIGADKVVGLMTEDGLDIPGFDGTGYVTDEELEEELGSLPIQKGAGHDSAVLKATPNPEDPTVDRTNVVPGQFSGAFGSRNTVGGNESFSIGGRNVVNGSDCFAGGYRGLIGANVENSSLYGYKNEMNGYVSNSMLGGKESKVNGSENAKTYHSFVWGRKNILGSIDQGQEIEASAVFGNENTVTNNYCITAGTVNNVNHGACSVFGTHLQTSAYGQTVVGRYSGLPNARSIFTVGCGFNNAPKTCFSAGWYELGNDDTERKVIWIGDTMLSEKQLKALLTLIS